MSRRSPSHGVTMCHSARISRSFALQVTTSANSYLDFTRKRYIHAIISFDLNIPTIRYELNIFEASE